MCVSLRAQKCNAICPLVRGQRRPTQATGAPGRPMPQGCTLRKLTTAPATELAGRLLCSTRACAEFGLHCTHARTATSSRCYRAMDPQGRRTHQTKPTHWSTFHFLLFLPWSRPERFPHHTPAGHRSTISKDGNPLIGRRGGREAHARPMDCRSACYDSAYAIPSLELRKVSV
jgi:hypothetical protein